MQPAMPATAWPSCSFGAKRGGSSGAMARVDAEIDEEAPADAAVDLHESKVMIASFHSR
jgi:hypothetical protein